MTKWPVMRAVLINGALAILLLFGTPSVPAASSLSLYASQEEAQQHCPRDAVVWLNLPTRVYHFKGQRWYGRTKNGAYVCLQARGRRSRGLRSERSGEGP